MLIEHLLHTLLRRGAESAQRAALRSWRGERGALTQPEQWLSFFIEHLLCPGNQAQGQGASQMLPCDPEGTPMA